MQESEGFGELSLEDQPLGGGRAGWRNTEAIPITPTEAASRSTRSPAGCGASRTGLSPTASSTSAAGIDPSQIDQLMQQAQQLQAQAGQVPGVQMPGMGQPLRPQPQANSVEQLEKLAKLKESGALTEADFEAQKRKIFGLSLG